MTDSIKVGRTLSLTLTAANAAALDAAYAAAVQGLGESQIVETRFAADGTNLHLTIIYIPA